MGAAGPLEIQAHGAEPAATLELLPSATRSRRAFGSPSHGPMFRRPVWQSVRWNPATEGSAFELGVFNAIATVKRSGWCTANRIGTAMRPGRHQRNRRVRGDHRGQRLRGGLLEN